MDSLIQPYLSILSIRFYQQTTFNSGGSTGPELISAFNSIDQIRTGGGYHDTAVRYSLSILSIRFSRDRVELFLLEPQNAFNSIDQIHPVSIDIVEAHHKKLLSILSFQFYRSDSGHPRRYRPARRPPARFQFYRSDSSP